MRIKKWVEIVDVDAASYISQTVKTDFNGFFSLGLKPSNYLVKITGYLNPSLTSVVVEAGKTTSVDILVDTGIR